MSWLDELRLRDIDNESIIEATCLSCGHTWKQTPIQLLLKVDHRDEAGGFDDAFIVDVP